MILHMMIDSKCKFHEQEKIQFVLSCIMTRLAGIGEHTEYGWCGPKLVTSDETRLYLESSQIDRYRTVQYGYWSYSKLNDAGKMKNGMI